MQQTNLATAVTDMVQDNLGVVPRSTLINRNIMVGGRRTSVRLEPEMWTALLDIARRENQTIHALATQVAERKKPETSLTAAIRVFCLAYYRSAVGG
jgi:predicted DNA-binding ribbon-helix-helix protein